MRTFSQIRESKNRMPPGEHVFDQKTKDAHLMIHKDKGKFVVYIDNEKLDSYNSLNDAKRAGMEFVKLAKKG